MEACDTFQPELIPAHSFEVKKFKDYKLVESIQEVIEDLFRIDFPFIAPGSPEYIQTLSNYITRVGSVAQYGVWAVFPWKKTAVHLPPEDDFFKLRTARNKFLITEDEQTKFYQARIGIAGLSVGSSVLNALVLSGGGKNTRVADNDTLSIVNLNRLFASVCDLGENKAIAASRRVYEINPFQKLEVFTEGLTSSNMKRFFGTKEKTLDLFVEEMDNIKLKIETRFKARELRIPVIMATDNGDNTILDIERFDLEPSRALFHGRVGESVLANVPDNPSMIDKVRLANSIVGPDVTPRTRMSLTLVGSKLPAWPQLGNAANLSGVAVSYVARRILTGEAMPSGRYEVNFDTLLDPDYRTEKNIQKRAQQKAEFIKGFELLFGE